MDDPGEITRLLEQAESGRGEAMDRVVELVYDDLRRRAGAYLRGRPDVTLQPTALVNEAWLKLIRRPRRFEGRDHFFAVATKAMLRILIDHQRSSAAAKRGGDRLRVTLTGIGLAGAAPAADAGELEAALDRLQALDPRKADVVRLRAVWGLELTEIAGVLDVSRATVDRDWRFARNWLAEELGLG